MTTDVLIDVDGVINAVTRSPDWDWPADSMRRKKIAGFMITWSDQLISELNMLSVEDDIEIFWLTTWQDLAVEKLAPNVGLSQGLHWPVIGREQFRRDHDWTLGMPRLAQNLNDWWKLDAAQEHYNARRNRFVWIDDDLAYSDSAIEWAKTLPEDTALLVAPRAKTGITQRLLKEIVEWIKSQEAEDV